VRFLLSKAMFILLLIGFVEINKDYYIDGWTEHSILPITTWGGF